MDARLQRRRRGRPRARLRARTSRRARYVLAEALRRARARRGRARSLDRFPGARHARRRATSRRSRSSPAAAYGEKGHTVLPGDFVTAEDGTGLVHTAIAFGEDDFRLGARARARTSSTRCGSTAPTTSASARTPAAGSRTPTPTWSRTCARAAGCCAPRRYAARLPALLALRHAAALLRQAVLVHPHLAAARPAAGRQRDGRLAPGAHQARALRQLAGEQRRLGDLARALLGHAAAGLALRGRPRARAIGSFAELEELSGRALERPAPPVRRRRRRSRAPQCGERDAPRARGDRRLVRLGRDAVRPAPRAVREPGAASRRASRPTSSARRSTRRAAGSTRCSRSRRCCSTASPYQNVVCLGLHPRRRGQEDVQVAGQHRRRRGRCSTATAPTRSAGTSSPPSSRGTATASRVDAVGERVRQFLLQLWNTYGFYVLYANVNGVEPRRRRRAGATTSTAGSLSRLARDGRRRSPSAWTTTTRRAPAARSRRSSTTSPTGTCGARGGASGTATRPRSRRCATAW